MSEFAPGRQRDFRLAQPRNGGAPAPSVNDLGLNEQTHRAGLVSLVRPSARKASPSPAAEKAGIIKSYYHWNNRILGLQQRDAHAYQSRLPTPPPGHSPPLS